MLIQCQPTSDKEIRCSAGVQLQYCWPLLTLPAMFDKRFPLLEQDYQDCVTGSGFAVLSFRLGMSEALAGINTNGPDLLLKQGFYQGGLSLT